MRCPQCHEPQPLLRSLLISPWLHGRCAGCGVGLTKTYGAALMTALPSATVFVFLRFLLTPTLGEAVALGAAAAVGFALFLALEHYLVDLRVVSPES
ncbi:MAG: hypothetical protein AAGM22_12515 [Acidobacteriota bacterium]